MWEYPVEQGDCDPFDQWDENKLPRLDPEATEVTVAPLLVKVVALVLPAFSFSAPAVIVTAAFHTLPVTVVVLAVWEQMAEEVDGALPNHGPAPWTPWLPVDHPLVRDGPVHVCRGAADAPQIDRGGAVVDIYHGRVDMVAAPCWDGGQE
ncbi:hypothetical protein DL765_006158 [Monosporascus sp. GIB2]|nr:hypothetical protein DL765_006158 [Monosporascus sp. GIB2]